MNSDNTNDKQPQAPQDVKEAKKPEITPGGIIYIAPDELQVSRKDKALMLTIALVLLVVAALAVIGFITMKPQPDFVQGQADATEVRISGKLPGRIMEIYVEEGQYVHAGDTLVHIHSSLADARMAQAQAAVSAAQATNQKVDAGTRPQITQSAYEVWQQAVAAQGIAKKTYDRMEKLFADGVVSAQKRDEARAAYEAATAGAQAAKSQYDLAVAGPQSEDKSVSAAMVNVARGGVKEVNALLEDSYLIAPCDGEITVIYPHVSELIATGAPIMELQTNNHWVVFNLRENYLNKIRNGSDVKVNIPALKKDTVMRVFYIRDLGTYANWQATKATGDFDARTFEVKMRPAHPIDGLRPGMSVILKEEP